MANKTAVEFLVEHLAEYGFDLSHHKLEINQSKEREKQQIIDAYVAGDVNGVESMINYGLVWIGPEEYYSKTFKSE